ncbi:MAG: hypothetical protein Q7J54_04800 [Candidatus Woesearchaeota archaeon]|nr:hypothetical protein [Candidatus Woesearchaeota archaeon]
MDDTNYQPSKDVAERFGLERCTLRKYANMGLVGFVRKSKELYVSVEDTARLVKGIKGRRLLDSFIKKMYVLQREEVEIERLPTLFEFSKNDQRLTELIEPALWFYSHERKRYIDVYDLDGKENEVLLMGEVLARLGISCKNVIYYLVSERYLVGYEPKKNRAKNGVRFILLDSWLEYIGNRKGKPLFNSEKVIKSLSLIKPEVKITNQRLCDIARENNIGSKISPKKKQSTFLFTQKDIYNLVSLI